MTIVRDWRCVIAGARRHRSRIDLEDSKIRLIPGTVGEGFPSRPLSGRYLLQPRAKRGIGLFHVITNFTPLERRDGGRRKRTPRASQPVLQRSYVLIQSVGQRSRLSELQRCEPLFRRTIPQAPRAGSLVAGWMTV